MRKTRIRHHLALLLATALLLLASSLPVGAITPSYQVSSADGTSGAWYYILSRQGAWEAVNAHLNVYETPVDDRLFDRDYRLTDPQNKALLAYYKTYLSANEATAHDIREHGVSVRETTG